VTERPISLPPRLARWVDATSSTFERLFRDKGPLTPPWRVRRYVGYFDDPREYERSAALQISGLRSAGVLTPTTSVLDVGCGAGRIASALAAYLTPGTRYEGLDPQPVPIRWCRQNISTRFPNFDFHETGTYSPKYNPQGRGRPEDYRFPFEGRQFDLVLLLSVLTHVSREVEETLLRESERVLVEGGRLALTEYLLTEETRRPVESGLTSPKFPYPLGQDRSETPGSPEGFVVRDSHWAESLWGGLGLSVERWEPGSWAGRGFGGSFSSKYSFFQDLLVLRRGEPVVPVGRRGSPPPEAPGEALPLG
jgi:SAM-dependent methyltransferase